MFVAAFSDLTGTLAYCRAITKSPLQPRILDVLDPSAAALFAARMGGSLGRSSWVAVVEAAGYESVLDRHARDLSSFSREARATEFIALDEGQRDQLFGCLCEFSPIAFSATSAATIFRIGALPSAMPALLEETRALAERHTLGCAILIRGLGVVYVALLPPADQKIYSGLVSCSRELMDVCIRSGAAVMVERGPLEIKNAVGAWPPPGTEREIAQRLKRVFDPEGILSPGRFRGYI